MDCEFSIYHSQSLAHDIGVSDVAKKLQRSTLNKKILTENEVKCIQKYSECISLMPFKRLNTDIIWEIQKGIASSFIAVEFERSLKNQEEATKKIADYYDQKSIGLVLYITENQKISDKMMKYDKEISGNQKSKIFFCNKADFFLENIEASFQSSQKKTIKVPFDN